MPPRASRSPALSAQVKPLSEKQRLQLLKQLLSISYKTLARATYRPAEADDEVEVFGGRGDETVRKLFDPTNSTTPWRASYARPIILWLRQHQGFPNAPDNLFAFDLRTRDAFSAHLRANHLSPTRVESTAEAKAPRDVPSADVATLAAILEREASEILRIERGALNTTSSMTLGMISRDRLMAAALEASQHLDRYEGTNEGEVALTRYIAYVCYWFARLKPISDVRMTTPNSDTEITDINERVALNLIPRIMLRIVRGNPDMAPPRWKACRLAKCGGGPQRGQCFFHKYQESLQADEGLLSEWLTYMLGNEPSSANVLRILLEQSILLCCEDTTPALA